MFRNRHTQPGTEVIVLISRSTPRAFTDFNSVAKDGSVRVAPDEVTGLGPVQAGDPIIVTDEDGNICQGQVVAVAAHIIRVEPVWSTWVSAAPALPTFVLSTPSNTPGEARVPIRQAVSGSKVEVRAGA
jgi:hypothetical protein